MKKSFKTKILLLCFFQISITSCLNAMMIEKWKFTATPLNLVFSSIDFDYREEDSKLDNFKIDAYISKFRFGFNHPHKNALQYSFELGVFPIDNFEIYLQPFVNHETSNSKNIINDRLYEFKSRNGYGTSIGIRKYFDISTKFLPFLNAYFGFDHQKETKAKMFIYNPFTDKRIRNLGQFTFQKRKTYNFYGIGTGALFKLHEYLFLSCSVNLNYRENPKISSIVVQGRTHRFRDKYNLWSLPVSFGAKIIA